jgi:signal transduction histidine kinase/CheY-like chemotaxis protein
LGDFYRNIVSSENGSGTYFFDGVERLCIYKHITGSRAGWRIAISVPLDESPIVSLRRGLLFSALCFLAGGMIVSIIVSRFAVKPFYRIEEQNRSLAVLNESVKAASEAKSNFLARMSHEMRTPLNAIIGLSELSLETSNLDEESMSNLEKIFNAGETLLSTVNDILDISKIEAGKLELVPAEYDIPSMLNDTVTQSMLHIGEKPVKFNLAIDGNLPAYLYGDELRVKQIMNNLLSNAFKYTKEGMVELGLNCERDGETIWLTIKVRDTGIGIRKEDFDKLFSDYAQVDMAQHKKIMGTGLGLPILKKMVEMMEGSVGVESEYGKGSTFTVKLKQKFAREEVIGTEVVNNLKSMHYSDKKRHDGFHLSRINLSSAHVLVVDDVETNLDVARGMMKPYGVKIDCVTSGQQAVDAIREEKIRYDAVFMDHMMPEMDGIEATKIIREEIGTEYAKTVPIIALTANAIVGNEDMFLHKGFQAFLSKPIEIARLDAVMREWVGSTASLNKNESVNRLFDGEIAGLDMKNGLERFGGDDESYHQILRSFVKNTPSLLVTAKAVSRETLGDYSIAVHGIKGSGRSICAGEVGEKAEALEKAAKAGDLEYVTKNNAPFIEVVEKMIDDLAKMLLQVGAGNQKTKKEKPDWGLMTKLIEACEKYDIAGVEAAMKEMETYEYETEAELVSWLRENVDQMNFALIVEKFSGANG